MATKSLTSGDRRRSYRENSSISTFRYGMTEQIISVTDMISEGPIQGLVHGGKSIYVNNDNLFSDDDTGYTSSLEEKVSWTSGNSYLTLSDDSGAFIYSASSFGERYIFVHNIMSFTGASDAPSGANKLTGRTEVDHYTTYSDVTFTFEAGEFDQNFPNFADLVATSSEASSQEVRHRIGVTQLIGAKDREVFAYIIGLTYNSATETGTIQLRVHKYGRGPLAAQRWLENRAIEDFEFEISQFLRLSSITTVSGTRRFNITNPSQAAGQFTGRSFSITADLSSSNSSKYLGTSYEFRPGTVDQLPIQSLYGTGSTSVALPTPGVMEKGVTKTITASGAQASEIDLVNIVFNYPSGLYGINTENSDKYTTGAGYKIVAKFFRGQDNDQSEDSQYIDIPGNLIITERHLSDDSDGAYTSAPLQGGTAPHDLALGDSIHAHGGKSTSSISFNTVIDLEPYKPFNKFALYITRVTNHSDMTDNEAGMMHTWNTTNQRGHRDQLLYRDPGWIEKFQAVQNSNISQVIGVIKEKLNYPYTSLANLTFSAKSFTEAPSRTYECYGMKVLVPDNYTTREQAGRDIDGNFRDVDSLYSGIWTGSFAKNKVYTDNPAWIFYDILSNNRYGIGEFIDEDVEIDKYSLYKIARYCDQLVPDGKGGLEPRFRANYYFQKSTDIYKVLKDMASTFRGMLYWMDGNIVPVIDEKKSPVYAFNSSNVLEGAFEYESTGSKTRTNQVVVSWNNPESDYKLEPLIIEDRENIIKTGALIKEQANAFGCTSEGQAIRYGRWKLWTAINQTEIVTFKTSINAAFLKPGDIITIQDNHDHGYSYSGRVSSASAANTFILDRGITAADGQEFSAADMAGKKISILTFGANVILGADATINNTDYKRGDAITSVMDGDSASPSQITLPSFTEINISAATAGVVYRITSRGDATDSALNTIAGTTGETYSEGDIFTHADVTAQGGTTTKIIPELEAYINDAFDDSGNILSLHLEPEYIVKDFTIESEANSGYTPSSNQIKVTQNVWTNTADARGAIWGIKDNSVVAPKEYKIMSISHENDTTFAIVAVEYYEAKFDAVDLDFTLATPDSSDPPEPVEQTPSPPQNLRILQESTYSTAKDEFTVQWDAPTDTANGVVVEYEFDHSVQGYSSPIITQDTSVSFDGVTDGTYYFEVRSITRGGRRSSPISTSILIDDIYGGNYDRTFGLLRGGKVGAPNSTIVDTTQNPQIRQFKFDESPVAFMGPNGIGTSVTLDTTQGEFNFSPLVAGRDEDWFGYGTLNNPNPKPIAQSTAYVVNDSGTLKFINHHYDSKLKMEYWYDQIMLNKQRFNENTEDDTLHYDDNPNIWVQQSGTVTIEEDSNKIVGLNTNFNNYPFPTILKFSPTQAARLSYIESNTVAYLDRSFKYNEVSITQGVSSPDGTVTYRADDHVFSVGDSVTITGFSLAAFNSSGRAEIISVVQAVRDPDTGVITTPGTFTVNGGTGSNYTISGGANKKATKAITSGTFEILSYIPNFNRDHLIGSLNGYSGGFSNYCFLDPDIQPTRSVTVDLNPSFIRFSGSGSAPTQITDSNGDPLYSQILLTAKALNFASPEFIITGSGFNDVSSDAPTEYSAEADGVFSFVLDDGTDVLRGGNNGWQNGNSIDFTVTVREVGDPLNPDKTTSVDVSIFRIQDGATGISGRTVFLNSEDHSILFDANGENPEYNGSSDSEIDLTANIYNFDDAIYKITLKRPTGLGGTSESVTLQDWADANDATGEILFSYAEGTGNTQWTSTRNSGYSFPQSQWPATITIEVAEKPSSGTGTGDVWQVGDTVQASDIKATDSVSIAGVTKGQGGVSIIMPNSSHAYTTDKFGDIGTGSTALIPNSGTTIEVLIAGEVGNYVGNATSTGLPTNVTDDDLNHKDWYFTEITHTGGDLTIGQLSVNTSTDIVTIGEHTMTNSANKDPSNTNPTDNTEAIEYVIKGKNGFGPDASTLYTVKQIQTLSKSIAGAEGAVDLRLYLVSSSAIQSSSVDYPTVSYTFSDGSVSITDTNQSWTDTYGEITAVNKYLYQLRTRILPSTTTDTVTVSDSASNWEFALVAQFADVGEDARSIKLSPKDNRGFVVRYDEQGERLPTSSESLITLQTSIAGVDPNETSFYVFYIDGIAIQNGKTDGTNSSEFQISLLNEPDVAESIEVKVELWEGATGATSVEKAQDTITIFAVKDGSGAITAFLTNESHVVSTNADGTIPSSLLTSGNITAAGGNFRVFRGSTNISNLGTGNNPITYSLGTGGSGATGAIDSATGAYTVSASNLADAATIEFVATIPSELIQSETDITVNKIYSISKSKKGDDAATSATVRIFKRTTSNTAPTSSDTNGWPSGDTTYTFSNGGTAFDTANGWSAGVPSSGGDYLWTTFATALSTGLTDTIGDTEWASPATLLSSNGLVGGSVNIVFKRSSTDLSSSDSYIPDDSSGSVPTVPTGWYDSPPTDDGNPLYASKGEKASGQTLFEWTRPYRVDGSSVAEVAIYSDSTTGDRPTLPTAATYNFTDKSVSGLGTDWNVSPPTLGGDGHKNYVAVATAAGTPQTTSASLDFGTQNVIYARQINGTSGAAVNIAFIRKATTPTVGTGTGVLPNGENNGWFDDAPTDNGLPLWATKGNRAQGSTEWSWDQAPFKLDGSTAAEIYFYSNATSGNMPAFTAPTYDFTSNPGTSAPTNWHLSPPSLTATGQKIYVKVVLYVGTPAATSVSATTVSADNIIYAQRTDGIKTAIVYAYKKSGSTPTTNPGDVTVSLSGTTAGTITTSTLANNWLKSPPAPSATEPVWVTAATAAGTGTTDNIAASEWTTPVQFTGDAGVDGVAVSVNASIASVTYSYDGTNWDPSVTSATVKVLTTGLSSVSYSWGSSSGAGTGATRTLSFSSNIAEAAISGQSASGSVTVSGTKSDGTSYSSGALNWSIPAIKASTGGTGNDGPRYLSGIVYATTNASIPTNATYNFDNNTFSGLGSWSKTPPTQSTSQAVIYYLYFYVEENISNGTGTGSGAVEFPGSAYSGTSFANLVVFQPDGNTSNYLREVGASQNTTINGGAIETGTVTATQLQISNSTGASTAGINMNYNSGNPKIEISDGTKIRVILGYLS